MVTAHWILNLEWDVLEDVAIKTIAMIKAKNVAMTLGLDVSKENDGERLILSATGDAESVVECIRYSPDPELVLVEEYEYDYVNNRISPTIELELA